MKNEIKIGDKVIIPDLERCGRVLSIWETQKGVKYEVRYFQNGDAKEVFFFDDEIKPINP